jgi:hypothetical protein
LLDAPVQVTNAAGIHAHAAGRICAVRHADFAKRMPLVQSHHAARLAAGLDMRVVGVRRTAVETGRPWPRAATHE